MISVCIATYNGEQFIQQQLKSILCQLHQNDEIVVSDANSTDSTIDLILKLQDSRIKLFFLPNDELRVDKSSVFSTMDKIRNNFQNALLHAKGDVIFLADQDDVWYENKVERICEVLKTVDCVVHDCAVISDEKIIIPSFLSYFKPNRTEIGLFIKSPFMGCCMAFNQSVLEKALPFPNIHIEHDTWIGICAYKIGKVAILDEILIDYRRHNMNASICADESSNTILVKLLRRYYMILAYFQS